MSQAETYVREVVTYTEYGQLKAAKAAKNAELAATETMSLVSGLPADWNPAPVAPVDPYAAPQGMV